jgi:selenocysteine lyase/cysteine desulfurase
VFSRHNYGFAWVSPRLSTVPHDKLDGTADDFWELGTRDTGAYAAFTEVVNYLDWLGGHFTDSTSRREKLTAAGKEISKQEKHLVEVMLNGQDGHKGLADMKEVLVIGGCRNDNREGLVSLVVDGVPSDQVVSKLGDNGIRVHIRKNDYFSRNILDPLNLETCVRVSMCHYNTAEEVVQFLKSMESIVV